MLLDGPRPEISPASDRATGIKFAARMIDGVKRVANYVLGRGVRDLSILGNAIADAAKCALDGVQNMMMGVFSDMDALEAGAEGLT